MKALSFARAFVASFALVALVYLGSLLPGALAGVPLPLPGTSGPSLGDTTTNLFTIEQSLQNQTFSQFSSFTTLTSTASTQNSCTQLLNGMTLLTVTLGGTGAVCLPAAKAGTIVQVSNNTSQTVNIFGVTPTTQGLGSGGNDFINGTIATTAYTGLTNGKTSFCVVPLAGNWWCSSGS